MRGINLMSTTIALVLLALFAVAQAPVGNPQILAWVDRQGKPLGTIGEPQALIEYPTISPDGTKIVVKGADEKKAVAHIWIVDVARGTRRLLTTNAAGEAQPTWSPKGDRVVFASYRNGLTDLFIKPIAGSEEVQLTASPNVHDFAPSWSPDGKYIVFHTLDPKTNQRDVMYLSPEGDHKPMPFVQTASAESSARFSPDGRYIAYASDESGTSEIYVKPFPPNETRWRVSTKGGVWPKWSPRGDELFFFEGNNLMSAPVQLKPAFKSGDARKLFTGEQVGLGSGAMEGLNPSYEPTPDGKKFVVVQTAK